MTRLAALTFACFLALAPGASPAAIRLGFGAQEWVPGSPGAIYFDVFAEGLPGDTENEQLFAYDMGFVLERLGGGPAGGVGFASPYASKPTGAEGFVFGDQPTEFAVADNPAPAATRFLLNVVNNGATNPDVTGTPVAVARVHLTIAANAVPSRHRIRFDPELTVFGSGDFSRVDPNIHVVLGSAEVFFPEPSAALLLPAAGLVALRRCRRLPAGVAERP